MLIVNIIEPLVGTTHELTIEDVSNWVDIINQIDDQNTCDFTVNYDGVQYEGTLIKSVGGDQLLIAFSNIDDLILPRGMCLDVVCNNASDDGITGCYNNGAFVTGRTRLMVLDEEGCPVGYATMQQIIDIITTNVINNIDIPTSLCDLLNVSQIPQGSLVASDRVLTTSNGCNLKSVPQNQVVCS